MKIGLDGFKNSENSIEFSKFFNDFTPIFVEFSGKKTKKIEKARYKRV